MSDPAVVVVKRNRAKVRGAVLCMVSTLGCVVGAGTESVKVTIPSMLLFFVGLVMFIVGRLRD